MRLEHVRTGAVTDVSDSASQRMLDKGRWRRADVDPPAQSDLKDDWVEYAKEVHGYNPDEGLTKQQLIDEYG